MPKLAWCIESGFPVVLEQLLESVDAFLAPILNREVQTRGRHQIVALGDRDVEVWLVRHRGDEDAHRTPTRWVRFVVV